MNPNRSASAVGRCIFSYLLLLALGVSQTSFGAVRITEFLAQNDGGLRDADGDSSDWIELFNDTPAAVDLAGWHLTDSASDPAKWSFPATNLDSGVFLIVYASGKDRSVPGAELHTNFQLDNNGGYLALVQPDGTVQQAITYPAQRVNVSFGTGRQIGAPTTLLALGAQARIFVPTNDALGLDWRAPGFNDSGWFASNTPIAFLATATNVILSLDFNDRDTPVASTTQPGFSSFVISSNISSVAIQTQATTRVFGAITVTVSNTAPLGYDDRLRSSPATNGAFTDSLLLRDFIFSQESTGTGGLDVGLAGLAPSQPYRLTVWSFDSGSLGNRVSDWFANGVLATNGYTFNGSTLPTSNGQYRFSFNTTSDVSGRILLSGRRNASSSTLGVFLNALQITSLAGGSASNGLGSLMLSNNATAYLRVPFTVVNPDLITLLKFRIGYDDGFAAYINGQLVAARNAPASPAWNSTATAAHSASPAEDIAIIPAPGLLVPGANVLAIQGLNVSRDDPDFSLSPELFDQPVTEFADRYFQPPTPGVANDPGYGGLVADTKFSMDRGFYDAPFSLSITSATAGAEIRFTTNGSPPSPTNGFIFTMPITISGLSFIRAAAFKPGLVPSDIDTHTYLFVRDVLRQSNNIPNYPTLWQGGYPADYAMDSNIVNHPFYGTTISNDLRSIPSLSIVSEHNGLWSSATGIYPNSTSIGPAWERAASVELIAGSGQSEFALNGKIQVHGNASRDNVRTPKHSLGVGFTSDYGPTKLRYDWFGGGVDVHNSLVLRACGFVDGWAGRYADDALYTSTETGETFRGLRYRPENTCYLRDSWVKDSFRAMGWSASRSAYVHLYLNGLYWGLYEPSERLEASYFSLLYGGQEGAWDVLVGEDNNGPPVVVDGSVNDWQNVLNLVNAGIANEASYQAIAQLVDLDNLMDYMLLHIFAESEDWPRHNWYVAHRRATNGVPATRFICSVWDQELTLDRLVRRNRIDVGTTGGEVYSPARVYSQLRAWPEFRRQFGDRIQKHLFNGGALAPTNNVARLLGPGATIHDALVGESARWGDARKNPTPGEAAGTGQTFTRDEWWQPEMDKLATNFFQTLTMDNVARFRAGGLYPNVGAPQFNQFGGAVTDEFALVITQTNVSGTVFFTVDGSDPRTYGTGAVAPGAQAYSVPVTLNSPTVVRARVFSAGEWSALVEAVFYPPQDLSHLSLTEIMYNPPTLGATNGDEFEFLELKNAGTNLLNLSGLTFSGVNFTFTNGTTLAPGAFFVLARNPAAFEAKYPGVTVNGAYTGKLDNGGETLTLSHPLGATVFSVTYDDEAPWPVTPDNFGFSLVPKNPGVTQAPDKGASWRASAQPGGSPGADDPEPGIPAIVINEILTASTLPDVDTIELFNPTPTAVNIGGWFLSDDHAVPKKFRIPDSTMIADGGYIVFDEAQFNATPGTNGSFSLSAHGESVYLFSGDANTNLTGYSHGFTFDAAPPGVSFGRYVNSVGEEQFPAQLATSFASLNAGPLIGPVVINEIHYHPAPGGDEFVELQNISGAAASLFDPLHPTNTWRLNGLGYSFPTNITLEADALLLLVATNPALFRLQYNVPTNVVILGPYPGQLQKSGERLKLQRPDLPDTNGLAYITVEEVHYNNKAPWPAAADGSGPSLQRNDPAAYGNDPSNWQAGSPTSGLPSSPTDSDGDGLPDWWEVAHGTDPLVADADADPDHDGATNLQEYLAGTNPQSAQSRFRVDARITGPGLVTLEFLALANRTYSVLYKDSLDAPTWSRLNNLEPRATNRIATLVEATDPVATRFYRIVSPQWSADH